MSLTNNYLNKFPFILDCVFEFLCDSNYYKIIPFVSKEWKTTYYNTLSIYIKHIRNNLNIPKSIFRYKQYITYKNFKEISTEIFNNSTNLKYLNLRYCTKLDNIDTLSVCNKLEFLNLTHSYINDITAISYCKQLKHLDLSDCDYITDCSPIQNCIQLEFLSLSNCVSIDNISMLSKCITPLLI